MLRSLADNRLAGSWASVLRRRRFERFAALLSDLDRPARILDVGGTQRFWDVMDFHDDQVEVVLLNRSVESATRGGFTSVVGDATAMPQFKDREFDVVFSNSVIEHLTDYKSQLAMAREVRRIGRRYWVQTPNRYFPLEPHALLPLFHFLPKRTQIGIGRRFSPGWYRGLPKEEVEREISAVRLLTAAEMRALFPDAKLWSERLFGLTKSIVAYTPPPAEA